MLDYEEESLVEQPHIDNRSTALTAPTVARLPPASVDGSFQRASEEHERNLSSVEAQLKFEKAHNQRLKEQVEGLHRNVNRLEQRERDLQYQIGKQHLQIDEHSRVISALQEDLRKLAEDRDLADIARRRVQEDFQQLNKLHKLELDAERSKTLANLGGQQTGLEIVRAILPQSANLLQHQQWQAQQWQLQHSPGPLPQFGNPWIPPPPIYRGPPFDQLCFDEDQFQEDRPRKRQTRR